MLDMEIMLYSIVVLFIAAAIQDYRKREVSDFITIAAWGLSAFVFPLQMFILYFVGAWAIASLCERLKQPLMGFGDVLWAPIFLCLAGPNAIALLLVAVLISQLYLAYKIGWKGEAKVGDYGPPFLVVLLGMLGVAFIAKVFFG